MSPYHRGLDDDPDTVRIAAAEHRRDHDTDDTAENAYETWIRGDHR